MTPQGIAIQLQNYMILLSSEEKITPQGIAIIAGFIIILTVAILYDKKNGKKFLEEIAEQYPVKEAFGDFYVTEKGELLLRFGSGTLPGYKKWNLSDIAYIATFKGEFSVYGKDDKVMRGEYLTPSKKKLLASAAVVNIYIGIGKIDGFVTFVKKHGPHIQHTVGGKVVED